MVEQPLVNLPRYDAYKDSGIEWLGDIPVGWEVHRFRNLFQFSKGLNITKENLQDTGVPCVNYGEVHSKYGFEVNPNKHLLKCVSDEYLADSSKSLLSNGDFIFADTSEDIEGSGNFSQLVNATKPVFAGYHTVIARPQGAVYHRFLAYVCDSLSYRAQIRKSVKGVKVYSVTKAILKDTFVWLPSFIEQQAIAAYLDQKTARIDQAVAMKERQIELLKERRQILIQQAVTRGLDPDAPLKDSGVDWIGEVPAHWDIKRAKYLFTEVDERSEEGKEELLSVSHMTGVTPRSEKNVTMFMAENYTGSKTCQKNDLVFNIMWAWMGALGVADRPGIVSSSYGIYRQRVENSFNPLYLEWLLKTVGYIEHYNRVSTGLHSSRLRFYSHMFMDMEIGFPSIEEQNTIVDYVQAESAKLNQAITLQQQQIDKLKEFRATLINSVVTGKVKVPQPEVA
ncbi:restriction endonuclease subunit S [Candidatus Sororendozoicomonas aggregata]|uniref:restriction endonuclease subunit S n=1 Tax=Candidatus Sororendozoicomonas aggregata TaxID=3073239 RepID=UPI002ED48F2A